MGVTMGTTLLIMEVTVILPVSTTVKGAVVLMGAAAAAAGVGSGYSGHRCAYRCWKVLVVVVNTLSAPCFRDLL